MSNEHLENQTQQNDEKELSFISASSDFDNLKIKPPKRWFHVSVALLVALIGSCIGAILGLVINYCVTK